MMNEPMRYGLRIQDIEKIRNVFASTEEVDEAVLYGSRAKGNYKPASDIDLVLKGEKLNTTIANKIRWQLDDLLLPYYFDISIFHQLTCSDLIDHINRVGLLFYSRS
ncbi:MAG: nucleotidyltransferase domain-containing protein [Clostridiales bacterium]|nr:nucleotidyltransferase domain-containing protein [Clostridiales bacterium]